MRHFSGELQQTPNIISLWLHCTLLLARAPEPGPLRHQHWQQASNASAGFLVMHPCRYCTTQQQSKQPSHAFGSRQLLTGFHPIAAPWQVGTVL